MPVPSFYVHYLNILETQYYLYQTSCARLPPFLMPFNWYQIGPTRCPLSLLTQCSVCCCGMVMAVAGGFRWQVITGSNTKVGGNRKNWKKWATINCLSAAVQWQLKLAVATWWNSCIQYQDTIVVIKSTFPLASTKNNHLPAGLAAEALTLHLATSGEKAGILEKSMCSKRRGHSKRNWDATCRGCLLCLSKIPAVATDAASQKYLQCLHPSLMWGEKRTFQKKKVGAPKNLWWHCWALVVPIDLASQNTCSGHVNYHR